MHCFVDCAMKSELTDSTCVVLYTENLSIACMQLTLLRRDASLQFSWSHHHSFSLISVQENGRGKCSRRFLQYSSLPLHDD